MSLLSISLVVLGTSFWRLTNQAVFVVLSTKTANVQEGDNVAIFGLGAVGLAVIQGCRVRKVKQIIAVDTNPSKQDWARKMGATDVVNPKELPEGKSVVDVLVEKTDGGCDHTL